MIQFLSEARLEAEEANRWYGKKDVELALEFESALKNSLEKILEAPQRWPVYMRGTRFVLLRKFPYTVVYLDKPEMIYVDKPGIWVVAIAHQKRKPGYWAKRLERLHY